MRQKGFTIIEGLLIAVIVGLIGYLGYMAYSNAQDPEKTSVSTNKTEESTEEEVEEESGDTEALAWTEVESGQGGFSIHIPGGNSVTKFMDSDTLRSSREIANNPNQELDVEEQENQLGTDSLFTFTVVQDDASNLGYLTDEYESVDTITTDAGEKVIKHYHQVPVAPQDGMGLYPGTKSYIYELQAGSKTTLVIYNVFDANQYSTDIQPSLTEDHVDNNELVDRIVSTLEVN